MRISVIICTYNRDRFLPDALKSLLKQNASPEDFEIVIVNNNSNDKTEEISLNFIEQNPSLNVSYYFEPNPGLSFARNRGIKEAKADLISYIDDDGIAREDYVKNLITAFDNNPEYGAVGGKVIPIYESGEEPAWMNKYIQGVVSKVDYGEKVKDFEKKYPAGCNMAFRKYLFGDFGGFNTDLVYRGDDKFVFHNLKSHGVKVLYEPNIFVNHFIDSYRTEPKFINKISKSIGASEKLRLQDEGFVANLSKLLEYLFKFSASIALLVMYALKGQYPKGQYSVKVMFYTILGYFQAKKSASL
jgi:glycosyltransferase involved in cell wall biosynthesis